MPSRAKRVCISGTVMLFWRATFSSACCTVKLSTVILRSVAICSWIFCAIRRSSASRRSTSAGALLPSALALRRPMYCCTSTLVTGSELTTATIKSAERDALVVAAGATAPVLGPCKREPPSLSEPAFMPCAEAVVASTARPQAMLQERVRNFMVLDCINRNC